MCITDKTTLERDELEFNLSNKTTTKRNGNEGYVMFKNYSGSLPFNALQTPKIINGIKKNLNNANWPYEDVILALFR